MSGYEATRGDYFETFAPQLRKITAAAEIIISTNPQHCVVAIQPNFEAPVALTNGMRSASGVLESLRFFGETVPFSEADEISKEHNAIALSEAESDISDLYQVISIWAATDPETYAIAEVASVEMPLVYGSAKRQAIQPTKDIKLGITTLFGVRKVGEVTEFSFSAHDDQIDHLLTITTVNNQIVDAAANIFPASRDMIRWQQFLGPEVFNAISPVMLGLFNSESEVDTALVAARKSLSGQPMGKINLDMLFDELKIRALQMKEVRDSSTEYAPNQTRPSAETLNKWESRLYPS